MRKKMKKRVAKKVFDKYANRTNTKNLSSKTMMRGGFHF